MVVHSASPADLPDPILQDLDRRLARIVQVPMAFDAAVLPQKTQELLKFLIDAVGLIHEVYLRQWYPEGVGIRDAFAEKEDEISRKMYRLIVRNGGPFDKMDHFRNLVGESQQRPGCAFYPPDLTRSEFEAYMEKYPEERTSLISPYTVVKRERDKLKSVPYHVEYAQWLNPASTLLRKAALVSENGSLRRYLLSRAMALLTDNYYQSDVDWIDLNENDVDMICGPYEVYDDGLMGLKASYEATVGVKEHEESAMLEKFTSSLDALEAHLPHDNKYKRSITGLVSPMVVMSDIVRGGDIATGYQAVAANLPNDPRVHTTKGTKKTFWKNMMTARLEQIVLPIGRKILDKDQISLLTSQGMLYFILLHELCHALGPRYVYGKSDSLSVNQALRDLYPAIEEGKADLAGLHSMKYFISRGLIPHAMEREVYVSYLASLFRTIRFGTAEAHGKAAICELNGLWDRGAILYDETTKRWSVRFDAIGEAISSQAKEYLTIQSTGDLNRATDFFKAWSTIPREIEATLHAIDHLPVDIEPIYTIHWN